LYFKAKWADAFTMGLTANKPFQLQNGDSATVPTMARVGDYRYAQGNGWQYAELPYMGDHVAMGVLLPAAGTFDAFRKSLTADQLATMANSAAQNQVNLELPKFTFDSGKQLSQELKSLGMTTVFNPDSSDLSGIPTEPTKLYVSSVVQKTHVAVDEDGTTAAAASGVDVHEASAVAPTETVEMHVDRPFLFVIRDSVSGQILFLGQVTDPRG